MGGIGFQRRTRQREVILEELRKLDSHPTAAGLYEIVRRRLPRISLGTVYRNLELLAGMGEIRKLDFAGSQARFDGCVEPHHHVRCVRCGRLDDLPGAPLEPLETRHDDCCGYEVLGYRLEFVGLCPGCRQQSSRLRKQGEED
jgi:Fur family ferric uptake transcriptional regulator